MSAIQATTDETFDPFLLVHQSVTTRLQLVDAELETAEQKARELENSLERMRELSEEYDLGVDPNAVVENLSVGGQQRLEILKLLFRNVRLLVLDDPERRVELPPQKQARLLDPAVVHCRALDARLPRRQVRDVGEVGEDVPRRPRDLDRQLGTHSTG